MAWKRSGVQFPLAPRDAAGQRPAVVSFSEQSLSGSNAGSDPPIVNSTPPGMARAGDLRYLGASALIALDAG